MDLKVELTPTKQAFSSLFNPQIKAQVVNSCTLKTSTKLGFTCLLAVITLNFQVQQLEEQVKIYTEKHTHVKQMPELAYVSAYASSGILL